MRRGLQSRCNTKIGADHLINYKETPEWGAKAKELTGGRGVDEVIEIGGPGTMAQSINACRIGGHISLIGVGPMGMTIRALDKETAQEYIAAKPGFHTSVEDGRLWVLKDGEEKSEKRISFIGAGPMNMTILAQSKDTVVEYLASKPGYEVEMIDGRLWVFKPGESHSEKHITLIGAGPMNTSIKALDKQTAMEYLAAAPGFETKIEDGRIWVFAPGQEHSEKHITLIGAGPMNMTVKALDRATATAYLAAVN